MYKCDILSFTHSRRSAFSPTLYLLATL